MSAAWVSFHKPEGNGLGLSEEKDVFNLSSLAHKAALWISKVLKSAPGVGFPEVQHTATGKWVPEIKPDAKYG
jgi:hypothetical protein